jgi:hypothetical protein
MKFLADPEWGAQEKLNGKRILMREVLFMMPSRRPRAHRTPGSAVR